MSTIIWSTVASVGIANAADANKLVILDSTVQLGLSTGVVTESRAVARTATNPAVRIGGTQVTAVLRYGVDLSLISRVNGLQLRFRDGDGFVTARLIGVSISNGEESSLLAFDSRVGFGNPSDSFRVLHQNTSDGAAVHVFGDAFYIELTLSVFQQLHLLPFPPAVSIIQLGVFPAV